MIKKYLNGLIQVEDNKKDEFYVYLCMGNTKETMAVLYGEDSLKIFLKGLGLRRYK